MAFNKAMEMMGGKSKPKVGGEPKGKEKPAEKGRVAGDGEHESGHGKSPFEGQPGKHFHMHHDGLSFHTHGQHEDGSEDGPHEHGSKEEAMNHMDQFFNEEGEDGGEPQQQEEPSLGGYGG